jgi:hypothetical protein
VSPGPTLTSLAETLESRLREAHAS